MKTKRTKKPKTKTLSLQKIREIVESSGCDVACMSLEWGGQATVELVWHKVEVVGK